MSGASPGEPADSTQKIPRETRPGPVRAVGEGQFLHQKTRLARHCVCGQLVVVRILNQRRVASRHSRIFLFEAAENACRPAPPSFRWHLHTYPNGRQTLAALQKQLVRPHLKHHHPHQNTRATASPVLRTGWRPISHRATVWTARQSA